MHKLHKTEAKILFLFNTSRPSSPNLAIVPFGGSQNSH